MRVVVQPYDPMWPEGFAQIKLALLRALSDVDIIGIEHVGSTSVPNLPAKPILDIDVIVSRSNVPAAIGALTEHGYSYMGELGIEHRHALRAPSVKPTRNLYVCVEGCLALQNHLGVRNVLRMDERLRDEYASVKIELAKQEHDDLDRYCEGKNQILLKILAKASIGLEKRREIEKANMRGERAG